MALINQFDSSKDDENKKTNPCGEIIVEPPCMLYIPLQFWTSQSGEIAIPTAFMEAPENIPILLFVNMFELTQSETVRKKRKTEIDVVIDEVD